MALSGAEILSHTADCLKREVHVPAWANAAGDDVVIVRGMTVREYELNQLRVEAGKSSASLIARVAVDASGGRLFKDDQIDAIAELPLAQMMELTNAVTALSGLTDDDGDPRQRAIDKLIEAHQDEFDALVDGESKDGEADPGKSLGSSPEPSPDDSSSGSPET